MQGDKLDQGVIWGNMVYWLKCTSGVTETHMLSPSGQVAGVCGHVSVPDEQTKAQWYLQCHTMNCNSWLLDGSSLAQILIQYKHIM